MNLLDFDDPVANERSNNSAVYINKYIVRSLIDFAKSNKKDPRVLAEYFLSLGINSAKYDKDQQVVFDIESL
ncbi:hypothetical protein N9X32_06295 [Pseudomonadales bacterium]|nr:hypothetical protein [Pseudomonadales bacterium]